jgi:hypothetical protein
MAKCTMCDSKVENKDNAGRFREKCCACIVRESARDVSPEEGRPIPGCECDDCQGARADS